MNEFILLLRNGFYPEEYIGYWENFSETTLLEKEEFYSNLNMEDTTDVHSMHGKDFVKILK